MMSHYVWFVVCRLNVMSAYRSLSVLKCTFELYEIGTIKNGLVKVHGPCQLFGQTHGCSNSN